MFGLSRLYALAGAAVAVLALIGYVRWDAVRDDRLEAERINLENRIEHIEDARDVSQEIDDLDRNAVRNELCRRVSDGDCPQ